MKNLVESIKSRKDIAAVENYLAKTSERNRLIFAMGINSGLRVSDILGLNVCDVMGKSFIEIREKKTGKYKRFPLNKKLCRLIREYTDGMICSDKPLFTGKKLGRLDRSQVYRFLNEACRAVGIKDINIGTHTMRKSFGYFFYKQYNDVALLQKILNHSSPSITLRYIGISQDEIDTSYMNFHL